MAEDPEEADLPLVSLARTDVVQQNAPCTEGHSDDAMAVEEEEQEEEEEVAEDPEEPDLPLVAVKRSRLDEPEARRTMLRPLPAAGDLCVSSSSSAPVAITPPVGAAPPAPLQVMPRGFGRGFGAAPRHAAPAWWISTGDTVVILGSGPHRGARADVRRLFGANKIEW